LKRSDVGFKWSETRFKWSEIRFKWSERASGGHFTVISIVTTFK
jgi:hypothetical protein